MELAKYSACLGLLDTWEDVGPTLLSLCGWAEPLSHRGDIISCPEGHQDNLNSHWQQCREGGADCDGRGGEEPCAETREDYILCGCCILVLLLGKT